MKRICETCEHWGKEKEFTIGKCLHFSLYGLPVAIMTLPGDTCPDWDQKPTGEKDGAG